MKFKIGDKVKIVSLRRTSYCFGVTDNMKELLDKIVTIQDISSICSCIINDRVFHVYDLQLVNSTELEIE